MTSPQTGRGLHGGPRPADCDGNNGRTKSKRFGNLLQSLLKPGRSPQTGQYPNGIAKQNMTYLLIITNIMIMCIVR